MRRSRSESPGVAGPAHARTHQTSRTTARRGSGKGRKGGRARRGPLSPLSSSLTLLGPVAAVPSLQWECRFIASGCKLAHHVMLGWRCSRV